MNGFLKKIIGDVEDKKEWKAIEKRANALPEDYWIVYNEIKKYIWTASGVVDASNPLHVLLDLFEEGAASGKHALDITGDDAAAFADELVRGEKTH